MRIQTAIRLRRYGSGTAQAFEVAILHLLLLACKGSVLHGLRVVIEEPRSTRMPRGSEQRGMILLNCGLGIKAKSLWNSLRVNFYLFNSTLAFHLDLHKNSVGYRCLSH